MRNADVQQLHCPDKCHLFRLTWDKQWYLDCAFFGGRIGATVVFPGPCRETWFRAEIITPLKSSDWSVTRSSIVLPRRMRVEWRDVAEVVPSVPIDNVYVSMYEKPKRRYPKR